VIKNAPYGKLAAVAQYKIGLYLMEKGMYPEARDELEKVLNDYPDSEWVKAAQYQIAVADSKRSVNAGYDQRITQSAKEEFEEFLDIYPDAELSEKAKAEIDRLKDKEAQNNYGIAQFYEKQKQFDSAKIYYQIVVDEYPTSKWSSKSLNKIRELNQKD
ncbi:MAG: outer membrane protein assembly factor BamD, partial [Candidatus Omnitrophica bacterium]|nr:outer membrane protein assembly factor BamD [Candidatus Omnitrophota bacterium]